MIKKISPLEWEHYIKKALYEEKFTKNKLKVKILGYTKYLPIPAIIGAVAAYLMYYYYGLEFLIKTLLSWTIGITLVTTIVAALIKLIRR